MPAMAGIQCTSTAYFRVHSAGNSETGHVFTSEQQRTVPTNRLLTNGTMATHWTPPPGQLVLLQKMVPICHPRKP
jgi:hypothetical protein